MKLHLLVIHVQEDSPTSRPAGLSSLLAGWDVAIEHVDCDGADLTLHGCMDRRAIDVLSRRAASSCRPDIVVIETGLHRTCAGIRQAVDLVRAQWGDVPVIISGSTLSLDDNRVFATTGADAVFTGQDESSLLHLLGTFGFRLRRLRDRRT